MLFLIILLILAVGGRLVCGTICPIGIIEELLYKIPLPKKFKTFKIDKYLMKVRYIIFILLLILIPLVFMPHKEELHLTFLILKIVIFSLIFILSLFIYRPFCKYMCPFGVFFGPFNKISPYKFKVEDNCTKCGLCSKVCAMGIIPYENPNSVDCIRCNKCINKCPKKAIHNNFKKVK